MPSGMGMDSNTHNLFITEFQNDVDKKFTPNGILVKSWGGLGSSNGKFSDPNYVVVHSKGNVFVLTSGICGFRSLTIMVTFITKWP